MKTRFLPLKTAFLLAAAFGVSATHSAAVTVTIGDGQTFTQQQLTDRGWDGTLGTLQFIGSLPPDPIASSSISAVLAFSEDATFSAATGNQNLSLAAGDAGAFKLNNNAVVGISGNTDSAIRLAAGSAFHVGGGGALNIRENTADNGAAIKTGDPTTAIGAILRTDNATFSNNQATYFGGAIADDHGNLLTFSSSHFSGNSAADGGAVYSNGGTLFIIDNSTLADNSATANGGGIHIANGASLTLSGTSTASSTLTNNSAQNGGAIYANGNNAARATSATISNTAFTSNTATFFGGAYAADAKAELRLINTAFTTNTAGTSGGALYFNAAALNASDSTFTQNTAQNGGAVFGSNGANLTFTDSTFEQNAATASGGALYIGANSTAKITVSAGKTSTFTGNTAGAAATPNSIHLATEAGATAGLNIFVTATGLLDIRDPLSGVAGTTGTTGTITIVKEGIGDLRLGGANVFTAEADGTSYTFLNIKEGRLRLYRADAAANATIANPTARVAAGSIDLGTKGKFYLGPVATLSIGGDNTITADNLEIAANSSLSFDLEGVTTPGPARLVLDGGAERFAFDPAKLYLENIATLADGDHLLVDASGTATSSTFLKPALILGGLEASGVRSADGSARDLVLEADAVAKQLLLHVSASSAVASAAELSWTGTSSDIWQHASPDNNWNGKTTEDNLLALTYRDGDSVIFGDVSGSDVTINLAAEGVSPGNVTLNNNQNAYTFTGGDITSTGTLTINGPKGLTLQNLTATFANGAELRNGWLVLDESELKITGDLNLAAGISLGALSGAGNSARLETSSLNVAATGYIVGNGEIHVASSFVNKGTLAPGFSDETGSEIGTFAISGAFENQGTIQIKIGGDGSHDTLLNIGTRALSVGGTVQLFVAPQWILDHETTPGFLQSATGAAAIGLAPGVRVVLGNTTFGYTNVALSGTLVNAATGEVRVTPYAKIPGARNGLEAFAGELARLQYAPEGTGNLALAIFDVHEADPDAPAGTPPPTPNASNIARNINAASPLGFAAIPALLTRAASDSNAALRDHLESRREQLKNRSKPAAAATAAQSEEESEDAPAPKTAEPNGVEFYFTSGGNILKNGTGASRPVFDTNSGFVAAGVDAPFGNGLIAGANVAGHFGKASFQDGSGRVDQSQYRATAYLSAAPVSWLVVDANVSGGISRFETKRSVLGFNNSATTDAHDIGAALYANTSFNFFGDSLSLTPFVGIEYLYLFADAFTEKGDYELATFRVDSIEQESLQVRAGANLAWKVAPGGVPTRFILSASYGRELADTEADLSAVFANSAYARKFNVLAAYASKDTVQGGPSIEISSNRSSLSLGYRYETDFADRVSHNIRAEFRVKF